MIRWARSYPMYQADPSGSDILPRDTLSSEVGEEIGIIWYLSPPSAPSLHVPSPSHSSIRGGFFMCYRGEKWNESHRYTPCHSSSSHRSRHIVRGALTTHQISAVCRDHACCRTSHERLLSPWTPQLSGSRAPQNPVRVVWSQLPRVCSLGVSSFG